MASVGRKGYQEVLGGSGGAGEDQEMLGGIGGCWGNQVPLTDEPQRSRAAGPAQARCEMCISASHFHMVFMGAPSRKESKRLVQEPPGSADL